jgi:hypothetical protein
MLGNKQRSIAGVLMVLSLLCCLAAEAAPGAYTCIKVTAANGTPNDGFGAAVAMDGRRAIVGAPGARCAYIFKLDIGWFGQPEHWEQDARLTAPDAPVGFGGSVAIIGDTAFVGSVGSGNDSDTGKVWVFHWTPFGWPLAYTLSNEDSSGPVPQPIPGERFGASLAVWDDPSRTGNFGTPGGYCLPAYTLVVGAPGFGASQGRVRVYEYWSCRDSSGGSISCRWYQMATLTASDGAAGDAFGTAVSGSGSTLVVGAPEDDDNEDRSGSVYVFHRAASGAWEEEHKLTGLQGSLFGSSVCLNGSVLAIGSPLMGPNGQAYVYTSTTICSLPPAAPDCKRLWSTGTVLEPWEVFASQLYFGAAVVVDGSRLVIGAPLGTIRDFPTDTRGRAFVWEPEDVRPSPVRGPNYHAQAVLYPEGAAGYPMNAGCSVASSGDYILVGCGSATGNPGEAFFYRQ